MSQIAIFATLKVLPGQQAAAEKFFARSREIMDAEAGTTSFFALKIDDDTYGIFDTFVDQAALDEHIEGASGKNAVMALIGKIFAGPPTITKSQVIQRGLSK